MNPYLLNYCSPSELFTCTRRLCTLALDGKQRIAMVAKHIIFVGRVQGVGFRYTAHNIARRRGLTGFVRNVPDGTVEMLAQGPAEDVEDCVRDIEESFAGYVKETKIDEIPPDPRYPDFKVTF
ncbi:MAG: acylphosphatase [Phycisphaerales bacterium]|nr:MAG: acylphosphatase [Phycisphaerales bacterium]